MVKYVLECPSPTDSRTLKLQGDSYSPRAQSWTCQKLARVTQVSGRLRTGLRTGPEPGWAGPVYIYAPADSTPTSVVALLAPPRSRIAAKGRKSSTQQRTCPHRHIDVRSQRSHLTNPCLSIEPPHKPHRWGDFGLWIWFHSTSLSRAPKQSTQQGVTMPTAGSGASARWA